MRGKLSYESGKSPDVNSIVPTFRKSRKVGQPGIVPALRKARRVGQPRSFVMRLGLTRSCTVTNRGCPTFRVFERWAPQMPAQCSLVTYNERPPMLEDVHARPASPLLRRWIFAFHHDQLLPAASSARQRRESRPVP